MEKFTTLTGVAAPLHMINVDTDMIIPKQFLKTIKRSGLGKHLFDEMRYDPEGNENPNFVLNKSTYRDAKIIVASENFGCGSSREHAPWALLDFGIRCIIAPSFGDIFYQNLLKNGLLPIRLPAKVVAGWRRRLHEAPGAAIAIDLLAQTVSGPDGASQSFEIDAFANGTERVARAAADCAGRTVVGGGDSLAAVNKTGVGPWISHLSTGGGAALEYVQGLTLPGVAALER